MALSRDCAGPSTVVSRSRAIRSGESALGSAFGLLGARKPTQGLWGKPRCLTSQLKKPRQPESRYAIVRPDIPRACNCDTVRRDRKSTRLNSSHVEISYAVFCLKKKK